MKNLLCIKVGQSYKVEDIVGNDSIKRRLNSLGILKNSILSIYEKAPLGDPIIIQTNGSIIALRKKFFNNIILIEY